MGLTFPFIGVSILHFGSCYRQHFAHLYGPVALVEDHKAEILHNGTAQHLSEAAAEMNAAVAAAAGSEGLIATPPSTPTPTDVLPPQRPGLPRRSSSTLSDRFPGVQLRRRSPLDWPGGRPGSARPAVSMARAAAAAASAGRPASTMPATGRPPSSRLSAQELAESSEALRKAFRANPFQKVRYITPFFSFFFFFWRGSRGYTRISCKEFFKLRVDLGPCSNTENEFGDIANIATSDEVSRAPVVGEGRQPTHAGLSRVAYARFVRGSQSYQSLE